MSTRPVSEALVTQPSEDAEASSHGSPEATAISRRKAIPLIGAVLVVASGGCNLSDNPFLVESEAAAEDLRDLLKDARLHRGGIQRFALHTLTDGVAVEVEQPRNRGDLDQLTVTVFRVDPSDQSSTRSGGERDVLEVHHVRNSTISKIESDYVLFYYLNEN